METSPDAAADDEDVPDEVYKVDIIFRFVVKMCFNTDMYIYSVYIYIYI